jgi:hypothetical protein
LKQAKLKTLCTETAALIYLTVFGKRYSAGRRLFFVGLIFVLIESLRMIRSLNIVAEKAEGL